MIARRPYYFPSKHVSSLPFKREETGLKNETTKEENEKKGEEKKKGGEEREREREALNDGGRSSPRLRKARATFAG